MSRRRGEFEHRTSIFEGAYRAWSHLGGLNPEDLEVKRASELDPLTNPIINDPRDANETNEAKDASEVLNSDGTKRRLYPYEPLPRSGLGHPYVQAILSPWLGPDADHDAIQLGLTTLRTWWQHRRKGESGSAIAALGTEKMKGVVEGYTRHFFNLAHCLVVNDKEQPPRSLFNKMKEMEKIRSKRNKKRTRDELDDLAVLAFSSSLSRRYNANDTNGALQLPCNPADQSLAQLDRMHKAQRRQLAEFEGMQAQALGNLDGITGLDSILPLKGQCVPGKIDLPAVVNAASRQASHLAHCGGNGSTSQYKNSSSNEEYGDPNTTPVVFVSNNGEIQIAMEVDGITCSHCIKIVETVLKGCNGNKSPIQGLLDAAADRALKKVLIRIEKSSDAKRVAFEAARNLAMVGYTARAHEMSVVDGAADSKATLDLGALSTAFEVVATTDPQDVFDWSTPCTCPDSGVLRADCARHSQMNTRIFDAFEEREKQVSEYMAGCGSKYGMPCTCGPNCKCSNCSEHCKSLKTLTNNGGCCGNEDQSDSFSNTDFGDVDDTPKDVATRNLSIISFGGNMRHMSFTSEATFGRAMSGLSALSIDWENLDDFDVNVDHSAHINNEFPTRISYTGKRSNSIRRSINAVTAANAIAAAAAAAAAQDSTDSPHTPYVSFKI